MSGPVVQLPGHWTSPNLLIRILMVLDSPWQPEASGWVHRETGERCLLGMGGHRDDLVQTLRREESKVRPSLPAEMDEIEDHVSIVEIQPGPGLEGREGCAAVLRCASAMIDAGGLAVRCRDVGLAHGIDYFKELVERFDDGDEGALIEAFVRPAAKEAGVWRTRGMASLGAPDVRIPGEVPEPYAVDAAEGLLHHTLRGKVPSEGASFRIGRGAPRFGITRASDPHNRFGVWALEPL